MCNFIIKLTYTIISQKRLNKNYTKTIIKLFPVQISIFPKGKKTFFEIHKKKKIPLRYPNIIIKYEERKTKTISPFLQQNNSVVSQFVENPYQEDLHHDGLDVGVGRDGKPVHADVPAQHRRWIKPEEKAKVVAAVQGTELIQFIAALAVFHQDDLK